MNALAKRDDWGQLGPEMRALANDKQRAFVENYLLETYTNHRQDNYGAQANAARNSQSRASRPRPRCRYVTRPQRSDYDTPGNQRHT
jgi:hypothetical protein